MDGAIGGSGRRERERERGGRGGRPQVVQGVGDDVVVVEGEGRDGVDGHPEGLGVLEVAAHAPADLHEGHVGHRDDAADMRLLGVFEPVDILGVLGPVDGTERVELHQGDVLQAAEFGEDAPGGGAGFFVVQEQAAGQFHVVEGMAVFNTRTADQEYLQPCPVEAENRAVDREVYFCESVVHGYGS